MRHAPSKDDLQMLDFLIDSEIPFVIVFTKADKLKPTQRKQRMESFKTEIPCFEDITYVEFSAMTGEGVEQIREIIEDVASEQAEYAEQEAKQEPVEPQEEPPKIASDFLTPNKKI